jgi:hypothetical protein
VLFSIGRRVFRGSGANETLVYLGLQFHSGAEERDH